MKVYKNPGKKDWPEILSRPQKDIGKLEMLVNQIFDDIRQEGDKAVLKYTKKFDKIVPDRLEVTEEEFLEAERQVYVELKQAITSAKKNIEIFHSDQVEKVRKIEISKGVECWRKSVAIEKVGFYVPGGTAPLFSTVLMLGIPAKIAGCREIILCTPPGQSGKISPAILYTARLAGIKHVFKVGGIQAIGAMAFGTKTIPRIYKIFGPGNQFVTMAKQIVSKYGIPVDMPAGPSEVMIVGDQSAVPEYIAADLLSQAEHGPDSQVLFITWFEDMIPVVIKQLNNQLDSLPKKDLINRSLDHSKIILVRNKEEAIAIINEYAPEHLILSVEDKEIFEKNIINAGSVFIGNYSPESAGDYASGTNHTLPTNGFAKAYSGVSVDSFVKKITFQHITEEGLKNIGPVVEIMAEAEQLEAHKMAISVRLRTKQFDNN